MVLTYTHMHARMHSLCRYSRADYLGLKLSGKEKIPSDIIKGINSVN